MEAPAAPAEQLTRGAGGLAVLGRPLGGILPVPTQDITDCSRIFRAPAANHTVVTAPRMLGSRIHVLAGITARRGTEALYRVVGALEF